MRHDWLWIWLTVALNLAVATGYVIIAMHWRTAERSVAASPCKTALNRLKNIFVFCGLCGYIFIPIKMFWPAWRLYDIFMAVLVYYTWRYVLKAADLKAVYAELNRSQRLREDLENSRADRAGLETRVQQRTAELEQAIRRLSEEVAERHHDAEMLANERNLLRTLIDTLPDLIYAKDGQGIYILNNAAHVKYLGAESAAQVVGKNVFDFFPNELAEGYHADDMAVVYSGKSILNEIEPSVDASGSRRSVARTKVPFRNESGEIIGVVGVARDVTEVERAEFALRQMNDTLESRVAERSSAAELRAQELEASRETLKKQSEILRSVLDSICDGVIVADAGGGISLWNPAAELLLGSDLLMSCRMESQSSTGAGLTDCLKFAQGFIHPLARAIRGEAFDNADVLLQGRNGRPDIWVSASGRPIQGDLHGGRGGVVVFRDITGQKQAAAELHESENRFRQLAERIDDVFWMFDLATARVRYISPAFKRVWGLSIQQACDNPVSLLSLVHPADSERVMSSLQRQLMGTSTSDAIRIIRPDGEVRWIWNRGFPIFDDKGNVTRVVGLAEDITDRRRAEEVNARLAAIVESSEDAIISKNLEGVITSWNAGAERLFGYKSREIIGQRTSTLIPVDRRDEESAVLQRIGRGDRVDQYDTVWIARGEHQLDVAITVSPIKDSDGTIVGASGIIRDMTDLRRAEDDMRDTTAQLRSVIDNAVDGIINIDENGTVESLNPAALRIFGYSREELIGRNVNMLMPSPYHAEHDTYLANYRKTGNRQIIGIGREVMGKRKDGSTFAVDLGVSEVKLATRRIFTGIVRDITQRKEVEHALVAAKEEAEAANKAKSEFLANMSHEIRTPLTAIVGFSDLMLIRKLGPSERENCLQVIRRNCQHLLGLINDILDLSKIEAGQMTTERIACDLPQLLADVGSMLRPRAQDKGLNFEVSFEGPIPRTIQTDPLRLKQILVNLLSNAIKFTSSGRVGIRTTCNVNGPSLALQFEIQDTGIGMTEAQLTRLFTPFTQGDESMSRRFGGTGLGLTISRRLAILLGGTVCGQSKVHEGSIFTATVDAGPTFGVEILEGLTEAALPQAFSEVQSIDVQVRGRILLAEDGPDNQRLISAHLSDAGAEVIVAENGRIALEAASSQSFDLILMDMQMPEMDGYQATAELRRRGVTIPIVALTAHAMAEDRAKCLSVGCSEYLTKPIDQAQLLDVVRCFLPKSPAADVPRTPEQSPPGPCDPEPAVPAESSLGRLRSSLANSPKMRRILDKFVMGLPRTVADIEDWLDTQNLEQLRRAVHQLKGAGGGYGFPQITDLATKAEVRIDASDGLETVAAAVNELLTIIRSIEQYDRHSERSNGESKPPGGQSEQGAGGGDSTSSAL
jgi:two-component system CheB/CheR fusion protein